MISKDSEPLVLLDLPPEILTQILLFLPHSSLLACQCVSHYLHNLISNSVEIQYALHGSFAMQTDNPHCISPAKDRLAKLKTKESRWEELTVNFSKTVRVPFPTSGIYDLTGGIYLLGDVTRKALHYAYLPSEPNQEVEWNAIHTEHTIIDMGLCVYEHDLLAIITTQAKTPESSARLPMESLVRHEIHLQLHSVSTGLPHPDAQQPVIPVMTTQWERPAVGIEIVGDNLVLILAYYENAAKPNDQVFIYEWKTGKLRMRFMAPYQSYSGLLFLTTEIFLLPNTNTERLEFWKIPSGISDAESPRPFFALALPRLNGHKSYAHISCRADPNPTSTFRHSQKPFHADPGQAIAIFNVTIRYNEDAGAIFHQLNQTHGFVFFVHRSSLVRCLDRFSSQISYDRNPQPIPYSQWGPQICRWFAAEAFPMRWITTTSGQRCIIIQDIGFENESVSLILLNFNQNDVTRVLAMERREHEAKMRTRLARNRLTELRLQGDKAQITVGQPVATFEQTMEELGIPEAEWSIMGLSMSEGDDDDWMDVLSDDDSDDWDGSVRPKRRMKAMNRQDEAVDDSHRCFAEIVYSNLPYSVCSSQERYRYNGVLLDEERILGLKTNLVHRITTVDILHYG